jgi:DNA-binding CsgD family transcriptional regulator
MPNTSRLGRRPTRLTDRRSECGVLDQLIDAVRSGESRVLVVRGEPGVGKSTLLDYVAEQAPGCQVERAAGVRSEMELAFAGLHQLCAPAFDQLEGLPMPQRDALRTAFGLSAGPVPDRFLVGLAVLGLLSEAAVERPLICLVDDEQWLDRASAQVLGFVARRLAAEPVGLIFAARVPGDELAGLPELAVEGLPEDDARALLDSALGGPVDTRVRDLIVAETRGNPLALLELPRGLTPAQLAGGFGLPGTGTLEARVEDNFRRQLDALPGPTRRLLQLAAADPSGDTSLVARAAERLGIPIQAAAPAVAAGLVQFGVQARFRHPLVRSVAYQSASAAERQEVHRALAEVTDALLDPDRRAWHRAQAAQGPDEDIAAELEHSAGRAQTRAGLAAAAAFLEHATTLTPDPGQRARRALAAAQAKAQAGASDAALDLLAMADAGLLDELQRAQADLVRAQVAFAKRRGSDAAPLLLKAAKRLEPIDADLARATYMDALVAALLTGRLATPDASLLDVARAACAAPLPLHAPRVADLLLDGLAAAFSRGYAVGAPIMRRALQAFTSDMPADPELRWLSLAYGAALYIWDDDRCELLSDRYLQQARAAGALSELPMALMTRVHVLVFAGDLTGAAWLAEEMQAAVDATGSNLGPYGALSVAALRGNVADASRLIETTLRDASRRGEGLAVSAAEWANAVLNNGLGRYREALTAAQRATEYSGGVGFSNRALVELIEAAVRTGETETAAGAYERLAEMTKASGTDWGLGVQARSQALLSEGEAAERLYREAIARLGRTRIRLDLARAHLLYGEWLRRERRRAEARAQLRTAHHMLEGMDVGAFAERAYRELEVTGETARKRPSGPTRARPGPLSAALTVQEAQVARLAREGLSNSEVGARLFISARTVQHHLSTVFTKLGITSRGQLHRVLPSDLERAPRL